MKTGQVLLEYYKSHRLLDGFGKDLFRALTLPWTDLLRLLRWK